MHVPPSLLRWSANRPGWSPHVCRSRAWKCRPTHRTEALTCPPRNSDPFTSAGVKAGSVASVARTLIVAPTYLEGPDVTWTSNRYGSRMSPSNLGFFGPVTPSQSPVISNVPAVPQRGARNQRRVSLGRSRPSRTNMEPCQSTAVLEATSASSSTWTVSSFPTSDRPPESLHLGSSAGRDRPVTSGSRLTLPWPRYVCPSYTMAAAQEADRASPPPQPDSPANNNTPAATVTPRRMKIGMPDVLMRLGRLVDVLGSCDPKDAPEHRRRPRPPRDGTCQATVRDGGSGSARLSARHGERHCAASQPSMM